MTKLLVFFLLAFLFGCHRQTNSNIKSDQQITHSDSSIDWTFDKTQGTKIIFKDNHSFETNLFELEYIGQIVTKEKTPFLVFSGRDCDECDANISIYIHSPAEGELIVANGQNRYHYPGIEKNYENDSIVYRARTFYGQVLKDTKGVIWYEDQLLKNGQMGHFIYLVSLNKTKRDTSFVDNGMIHETLKYFTQGLCKEINGRNFTTEP